MTTEAGGDLWAYLRGLLFAFLEPSDRRMALIKVSVMERIAAVEAEAVAQERERIRAGRIGAGRSGDERTRPSAVSGTGSRFSPSSKGRGCEH